MRFRIGMFSLLVEWDIGFWTASEYAVCVCVYIYVFPRSRYSRKGGRALKISENSCIIGFSGDVCIRV